MQTNHLQQPSFFQNPLISFFLVKMLWSEFFKPKSLKESPPFHAQLYSSLHKLINNCHFSQELPHILLSGPEGIGKTTLARLVIEALYRITAPSKLETYTGLADLQIQYLVSPVHEEFVPDNCPPTYQHQVIQDFVKTSVHVRQIEAGSFFRKRKEPQEENKISTVLTLRPSYKIIVLHRIDRWSHAAQHALRRIMEMSMIQVRFILTTSKPSQVIEPLLSRCGCMLRLVAPATSDLVSWLINAVVPQMNHHKTTEPWVSPSLLSQASVSSCITNLVKRERSHIRRCLLHLQEWFIKLQANQINSCPTTWMYPTYRWVYKWTIWLKQILAQWKLMRNQMRNTDGSRVDSEQQSSFPLPPSHFMDACHQQIVLHIKHDSVSLEDLCSRFVYEIWYGFISESQDPFIARRFWARLKSFYMFHFKSENVQSIPTLQKFMFETLSDVFV